MATLEQTPHLENLPPKYNRAYTARLLVHSFFFSQGSESLQDTILTFLVGRFGNNFDPQVINEAMEPASKAAYAIRSNERLHGTVIRDGIQENTTEEEAREELENLAIKLVAVLDEKDIYSQEGVDISGLTNGLIYIDISRLGPHPSAGGRRRQASETVTMYSDSYLSQWVFFGLMAQSTGMLEYDEMFAEVVRHFRLSSGDEEYKDWVDTSAQLIDNHLAHHPEQAELLPDWVTSQAA